MLFPRLSPVTCVPYDNQLSLNPHCSLLYHFRTGSWNLKPNLLSLFLPFPPVNTLIFYCAFAFILSSWVCLVAAYHSNFSDWFRALQILYSHYYLSVVFMSSAILRALYILTHLIYLTILYILQWSVLCPLYKMGRGEHKDKVTCKASHASSEWQNQGLDLYSLVCLWSFAGSKTSLQCDFCWSTSYKTSFLHPNLKSGWNLKKQPV